MVHTSDVSEMMDRMLRLEIFPPLEKIRLSGDATTVSLDPNLIMDARHRIFREDILETGATSILAEAKRLFEEEELRELCLKREQDLLQRELRKFERELSKSRPKFRGPHVCSKKQFANSDDDDFWTTTKRAKFKTLPEQIVEEKKKDVQIEEPSDPQDEANDLSTRSEDTKDCLIQEEKEPLCLGSIKITIKDKQSADTRKGNAEILRKCLNALRVHAKEEQRLRGIKIKIQQSVASRLTRKYFQLWRTFVENARNAARKRKEEEEVGAECSDERKIEMFISEITERQKEMMRDWKLKPKETVGRASEAEFKKKTVYPKQTIVEPPARNRLNAQKRIIEKQREKLAEQNRIIEELRLKRTQEEIVRSGQRTIDDAKETLACCGGRTRRTLIQLMRHAGYRDKSLLERPRVPSPPKFLLRMEARAAARRERVKLVEEERQKKLEEQRRMEEAARAEEEQEKRRAQQEAARAARRLREEQEQRRLREIERFQRLNSRADEFYRKYLLRHYVIEPLTALVEMRHSYVQRADRYYAEKLKMKAFLAWRRDTDDRCRIRTDNAVSFHNRKLLSRMLADWRQFVTEEKLRCQVARDFYDMNLLDRYFRDWKRIAAELKQRSYENEALAESHFSRKLKRKYFGQWKKYVELAPDIKESEKRKGELRQIVQTVIPDFNPIQRGVAIED